MSQNDRAGRAAAQPRTESWGDVVRTVVYALIIAVGVRTVAFEPFNIPSGSMIPTLLIGDYVFVSKYSYGFSRFSLPLISPSLFHGRIFGSLPKRGDVVVFRLPTDTSQDYIKRVIGLPGDRIQMIDGILHINGVAVKRQRIADYSVETPFGQTSVPRYIETLPNGVKHTIIEIMGDDGALDNTQVYTVPPDHIFCMGDNRDNSQDSRVLNVVGYIPVENLVGKAQFKFFSLAEGVHFWEFWKWPSAIRFGQIFKKAH